MATFIVTDKAGRPVVKGDTITDFRGNTAIFQEVTRGVEYNGTAKVSVTHRPSDESEYEYTSVYYATVFGLTVTTVATAEAPSLDEVAASLIKSTYATHGRCTLSCDCGDWETYIDADAIDCTPDIRKVRDLIEHTKFDHVTPRNVIATITHTVLDTNSL